MKPTIRQGSVASDECEIEEDCEPSLSSFARGRPVEIVGWSGAYIVGCDLENEDDPAEDDLCA